MNQKLRDEAVKRMRELRIKAGGDIEEAHRDADDVLMQLLRDLGYGDVAIEFEVIPKWYA